MATSCLEEDKKSQCSQLGTDPVVIRTITGAVGEDTVNEEMVDEGETFTDAVTETGAVRLALAAW